MLPEVVQAWPYLVLLGAIFNGTAEALIMSVLRSDIVHTLLMPVEVIRCAETFSPVTTWLFTLVWFLVSTNMLSISPPRQR